MQIKTFYIPVMGGEALQEDLNVFLRSKKILEINEQLVLQGNNAAWCFCVRYLDEGNKDKDKVDYKKVLEPDVYDRFNELRQIRRRLAAEEGVPPYAIFYDQELSALASLEIINAATMKTVKGIGDKKIEKYGAHFFTPAKDESTPPTD